MPVLHAGALFRGSASRPPHAFRCRAHGYVIHGKEYRRDSTPLRQLNGHFAAAFTTGGQEASRERLPNFRMRLSTP